VSVSVLSRLIRVVLSKLNSYISIYAFIIITCSEVTICNFNSFARLSTHTLKYALKHRHFSVACETTDKFVHVDKIYCHWKSTTNSVNSNSVRKPSLIVNRKSRNVLHARMQIQCRTGMYEGSVLQTNRRDIESSVLTLKYTIEVYHAVSQETFSVHGIHTPKLKTTFLSRSSSVTFSNSALGTTVTVAPSASEPDGRQPLFYMCPNVVHFIW